jgi:hypothetical protein
MTDINDLITDTAGIATAGIVTSKMIDIIAQKHKKKKSRPRGYYEKKTQARHNW